ncbi:MAG: tetratricopeptide repeat protein [Pseudomonadota bacterium]
MGNITGRTKERLVLSLVGNFLLADPDGGEIRISERKGRVLLAMLATAKDRRRSREWLKSRLWERSFDDQASNSLRQSLHALRKGLEPWSHALQADHEHVWLSDVDVEADPGSDTRAVFFEDAPRLDEGGEDWLREERQAFEARIEDDRGAMVETGIARVVASAPQVTRACILVGNPVVIADDNLAEVVAERLTNSIASTFRQNGYLETYDLRDMESNQIAGREVESLLCPPVLVETRVSLLARDLQVTILARVPATGKVVWTSSIGTDWETAVSMASQTLDEFVMGAVDSIEAVVMRQQSLATRPTLYAAVHQLFALPRDGLIDAHDVLERFDHEIYSANAQAWRAFSIILLIGERLEYSQDAVAEAHALLTRALETEPSNAVALAIAGHFTSFVHRDLQEGRKLLAESRRSLPNLAFGWDATAMNAVYADDLHTAREAADVARRLGRYSPYRFYYDASAVIIAALEGRHEDAIAIGEKVLAKRPDFLAVMRHMVASYAMTGRTEQAQSMFVRLRRLDPAYGTDEMLSPSYVLPAARSVELITEGLRRIDLLDFKAG